MAIGAIFEGNFTQSQYDEVHGELSPDNKMPPGLLYHTAGPNESGFTVFEVWESSEALNQYFADKLGAVLARVGINVQPRFFQVTNTMTE